jgi:hypothetical protein
MGGGFHLMKPEMRGCKCLHCKLLFVPDYRNRGCQKYCSTPACYAASKRARQQRWLSKPENRDHSAGRRTCSGCGSGERPIRVIESIPHTRPPVRYTTLFFSSGA